LEVLKQVAVEAFKGTQRMQEGKGLVLLEAKG
jgi:hypothetical protein